VDPYRLQRVGQSVRVLWGSETYFSPSKTVAHKIHSSVIPGLPDLREKENLAKIFASAPAWLIWFTWGDYTTEALGLEGRDLSSMSKFARVFAWYPTLPSGVFEYVPAPECEPPIVLHYERPMSPRERKRAVRLDASSHPSSRVKWPLNIDEPLR
jgi:hypothetical protein